MYRIVITRLVPNPAYDTPEEQRRRTQQNYGLPPYRDDIPTQLPTTEEKALTVDLTDDEFKAIKKAVLECM